MVIQQTLSLQPTGQSLHNLHPENFVQRTCPLCRTKSPRFDTFCEQCGEYLEVIFDSAGFQDALRLYITDLAKSVLIINRNQVFDTLFREFPAIGQYLAEKTLANLLRWILQEWARFEEELDQLVRTDDFLRESIQAVRSDLEEMATTLQSVCTQATGELQNPFLRLFDEYALRYGEFQLKWRVVEETGKIPEEDLEVQDLTKKLELLLSNIDKAYRALEGQEIIYEKQAQYQLSVATLPPDQFQPHVARILDEYAICTKVLQSILQFSFVNGRPKSTD